jgi:hypothetical protein
LYSLHGRAVPLISAGSNIDALNMVKVKVGYILNHSTHLKAVDDL